MSTEEKKTIIRTIRQKVQLKNGDVKTYEYVREMPIPKARGRKKCVNKLILKNKLSDLSDEQCKDILRYLDEKKALAEVVEEVVNEDDLTPAIS